jgi:hypothetical protein
MGGASVFERLESLAARPATAAAIGLWAAAEAVVLPVVPDVGLCLLVIAAPRQAVRMIAAVVAGALVGTLLLALLIGGAPDSGHTMLLALPGIDDSVIADAERQLSRDGILGFTQIGVGPPLKVYTRTWLGLGGDVPGLVVGSILNRLTRIGSTVLIATVAGVLLGSWIRRHAQPTLAAYVLGWVLVYAALWT